MSSNIKINNNLIKKNLNFIKYGKKKIFCKNFIFFIVLFKYLKTSNILNSKIIFKKSKKSVYTILRPPYRHKLSRHQIGFKKYNISLILKINLKKIILFEYLNDSRYINFFINNKFKWLESNIINQQNIKYFYNFYWKNYFLV